MQPITYVVAVALVASWITVIVRQHLKDAKRNSLLYPKPPGPRLVPYIGRIHDLPIQYMWLKFKEWSDVFGPIYYTEMLGAKFVIVSDEAIAEDLLVKRAKNNSDRPMMRSVTDSKSTEGGMEYLPLMGKNNHWARQRKFVHSYLTEASNAQYYGVINHEVKRWLHLLLTEPGNHVFTLEDMTARVMAQLTWDDPTHSEYLAKSAWGLLTQMSPAGPITNLITPLWHLPLWMNPWRRAEGRRHDAQSGWWMERYLQVKAKYESGQARPSWTRQYLSIAEKQKPLTGDQEASAALGMLAVVGIFTVAGPLHYFLLSMVYHPQWQAKIQKEIDDVCGGELPTLDDSPNLPILRACIKETMRWRPNVPTGVAHETEEDDFYEGYFIPRGTRILPLDWAFLRNPNKYPDPDNFRPERWLEPEWPTYQEPLTTYPTIKGMSSFGYGRRQCLGQTLTQDETLLACGGLMWAFNLRKKIDPRTGLEIDIPLSQSNSLLIIKPDAFELDFVPRSNERRAEIERKWRESDDNDRRERAEFQRLTDFRQKVEMEQLCSDISANKVPA